VSTVRGVNFDTNSSGSNATVQFYLNDAVISAGFLQQTMFDVGQIEVLRGPQGTLRGIAAPSGSITVTTRRPDLNEFGGYVTGTVNTIGGINANGAVNVPVIKDILAVRVAASSTTTKARASTASTARRRRPTTADVASA
jgi:iron complex outermembrane recepter protein